MHDRSPSRCIGREQIGRCVLGLTVDGSNVECARSVGRCAYTIRCEYASGLMCHSSHAVAIGVARRMCGRMRCESMRRACPSQDASAARRPTAVHTVEENDSRRIETQTTRLVPTRDATLRLAGWLQLSCRWCIGVIRSADRMHDRERIIGARRRMQRATRPIEVDRRVRSEVDPDRCQTTQHADWSHY
jgi:hypothetical protein